uniref:THO complex subunit 6 homolog n=2 Tax=Schistocephalus solidus TaxID=70667 RepID=A0A0X3PP41_SCHSO
MQLESMFDRRIVAHMSVLSAASSPCGRYFAFGTNFGFIYVFLLEVSDEGFPDFTVSTTSKLPYPGGVYSLITSSNRLYAASVGYVANISWENLLAGKSDFNVIHLPISRRALDLPEVNSLAILESTNMLYAACGDGSVASLSLNASGRSTGCFKAHDNSVYALSKAGEHELLSCSEDGRACFWDVRATHANSYPCQKFVPSEQNELIRKSVGNWLTVASIQEDDLDWFILGGGPKMSLWNRRASHYTAVFEPASAFFHIFSVYILI